MKKITECKTSFPARGSTLSENPAIEALIRSKRSVSHTDPVHISADVQKPENQPSTKAREALYQLFFQAIGAPPPAAKTANSYNIAPTYETVEGGDPAAMQEYARIVCEHVGNLNSLVATHREFLLPVARKSSAWPIRVGRRKLFGDDPDEILCGLEVGKETIAGDPNARFNPRSKLGAIAFKLIERIEQRRTEPAFVSAWCPAREPWIASAKALPPFTTKPSNDDKRKWLAVIEQVLRDDFRDPEAASDYLSLLTKPSYKGRREAVFFDKVRNEFETLWGSRRQPKSKSFTHSHASV